MEGLVEDGGPDSDRINDNGLRLQRLRDIRG